MRHLAVASIAVAAIAGFVWMHSAGLNDGPGWLLFIAILAVLCF